MAESGGGMDIVGGIANVGFGIAGRIEAGADKQKAQQLRNNIMQAWLMKNVPNPEQQAVAYKRYIQTGQLAPELEQAFQQDQSKMGDITTDSGNKSAQLQALQSLENEGLSGGLNLQDQATLQDQTNNTNTAARGRNDAITDEYARRGMGGSGLELTAKLQNAQNATQNQGMNSLHAAADSRARAMQSMLSAGELGGKMQSQEFNQKSQVATAQDAINQFNTRNRQSVLGANVNRNNDAQRYNLNSSQQISNANTDLSNQEQLHNKGLIQQQYDNQLKQLTGYQNAAYGYAGGLDQKANDTANAYAGIGSGVSKLANASDGGLGKTDSYTTDSYNAWKPYSGDKPGPYAPKKDEEDEYQY